MLAINALRCRLRCVKAILAAVPQNGRASSSVLYGSRPQFACVRIHAGAIRETSFAIKLSIGGPMTRKKASPKTPAGIRDRIKELRRIRAGDLHASPKNWRTHPREQVAALQGALREIGYADALLARELPDGSLELIDGQRGNRSMKTRSCRCS